MSIEDIDKSLVQMANNNESNFNEEILETLKKIIDKLPEKHRKTIELRYTEGFSSKKIASFSLFRHTQLLQPNLFFL